jgi:hypothetical protein
VVERKQVRNIPGTFPGNILEQAFPYVEIAVFCNESFPQVEIELANSSEAVVFIFALQNCMLVIYQ